MRGNALLLWDHSHEVPQGSFLWGSVTCACPHVFFVESVFAKPLALLFGPTCFHSLSVVGVGQMRRFSDASSKDECDEAFSPRVLSDKESAQRTSLRSPLPARTARSDSSDDASPAPVPVPTCLSANSIHCLSFSGEGSHR